MYISRAMEFGYLYFEDKGFSKVGFVCNAYMQVGCNLLIVEVI